MEDGQLGAGQGRWAGGPWWAERGIALKWSWQAESRERGEESFPPLPFPFGKKSLVPWESQTSRLLSEEKATWIAHGQSFVSLVFGFLGGGFVCLDQQIWMLQISGEQNRKCCKSTEPLRDLGINEHNTSGRHPPPFSQLNAVYKFPEVSLELCLKLLENMIMALACAHFSPFLSLRPFLEPLPVNSVIPTLITRLNHLLEAPSSSPTPSPFSRGHMVCPTDKQHLPPCIFRYLSHVSPQHPIR